MNLEDDEKGTAKVSTPGGDQEMLCVNEAGLYSLIFRSNKPEAKKFKRWVTHEVLPAIRRDGFYAEGPPEQLYDKLLAGLKQRRKHLVEQMSTLQDQRQKLLEQISDVEVKLARLGYYDFDRKLGGAQALREANEGRKAHKIEVEQAIKEGRGIEEFRGVRNWRSVKRWADKLGYDYKSKGGQS